MQTIMEIPEPSTPLCWRARFRRSRILPNLAGHRAHGGVPRLHGHRQCPDRRRLHPRARRRRHAAQALPGRPGHPHRTQRPARRSAPSCPSSRATSTSTTPRPIPISNSRSRTSPSFTSRSPGSLCPPPRSSTSAPSAARARTGPISEAFFPAAAGDHRVRPRCPNPCPPISPPILINPARASGHRHRPSRPGPGLRAGDLGLRRDHDQPRHGLARRGQADRPLHAPLPAQ